MSIIVPAERHIPISFADVYSVVKGSLSITQRQKFEEVRLLLQSLYAQDFMALRENLKNNFRAFSLGAKNKSMQTRVGKSLPPKTDLDNREQALVADFVQLMASARFKILTNMEWEVALAEEFMFHLPVAVNWDYFDDKLLTEFWNATKERQRLYSLLPQMSNRVLIFHRGITMASDSGMYISGKIDLLVDYLIMYPLLLFWGWLKKMFAHFLSLFKRKPKLEVTESSELTAALAKAAETSSDVLLRSLSQKELPSVKSSDSVGIKLGGDGDDDAEDDKARNGLQYGQRLIERKNLKSLMPTAWQVILNFPKKLTIEEPAFREVVVMYRAAPAGRATGHKRAELINRNRDERLKDILRKRNISIKFFHDIPMADMESIFPDKKVYIKKLSFIMLAVEIIGAIAGAIGVLSQSAGGFDIKALFSALSLIGARVSTVYSSMESQKAQMVQDMTNILYDKTDDSQEGVLSMLLEDMADQQLKEAIIAYIQLFMSGRPMTANTLDRKCEEFFDINFGLKLDFSVEDILPQLLSTGLVSREVSQTGDRITFTAVSIESALAILQSKWSVAYESLSKPPSVKLLPMRTLLADPTQMVGDDHQEKIFPDVAVANKDFLGMNLKSGTEVAERGLSGVWSAASGLVRRRPSKSASSLPGEGGKEEGLVPVMEVKEKKFLGLFKMKSKAKAGSAATASETAALPVEAQ